MRTSLRKRYFIFTLLYNQKRLTLSGTAYGLFGKSTYLTRTTVFRDTDDGVGMRRSGLRSR